MEDCGGFMEWLGPDMSRKILMCLEDPSDLVRASSVSSSWHRFVIANGLAKQLCLKLFPEMSSVAPAIELNNIIEPVEARPGCSLEWEFLKRDHRVFAYLARGLEPSVRKNCISEVISASSTDNYPAESIQNTLEPRDRVEQRASYWSSEGQNDPSVPEMLVYKLAANLCIISEIHVQPFQAYFQYGFPIYSAKAVRFRMGHPKSAMEIASLMREEYAAGREYADDKFVWTYTSPEFPMAQENRLQNFKLPEPVLCIGGILQIELLGRVQRQEMDGLYYICIAHVQAVGRTLSQFFDVDVIDLSGLCTLEYHPVVEHGSSQAISPKLDSSGPGRFRALTARLVQTSVRGWEQMIVATLFRAGGVVVDNDDGDSGDEQ